MNRQWAGWVVQRGRYPSSWQSLRHPECQSWKGLGDYLPPISYFIVEANRSREGQGVVKVLTRTSERRAGRSHSLLLSGWCVLSTDDIFYLLVVAHGFPYPFWCWRVLLAPPVIVNLRRPIEILPFTHSHPPTFTSVSLLDVKN